jgi:hypothetical protein
MTDKEIHKQFVELGRNAKEWKRKCQLLLPEIAGRKIWRRKGFSGIYEYAAKLAGLSKWQVDDALRILKKIEDSPLLKDLVERKGLSAVRPIVSVVTNETEEFWAEKAGSMGRDALHAFVQSDRFENGPRTKTQSVNLRIDLAERLSKLSNMEEKLERFLDEQEKVVPPQPVETTSRHIPVSIKRHIVQRTNGKCAFPGCFKPYEILHHTQRFALEKVHDPKRLFPLCKGHERLAHLGLIENEQSDPSLWKLRSQPEKNSPEFWIDRHVALYRPG